MTDQEQMLQRLFNKDKLIETVNYFCNNLGSKIFIKLVVCFL